MSAVEKTRPVWSISNEGVNSKHEKCRNITEEIYKRINITFQIKKLETAAQSDLSDQSDQIDSNELSNETDLFACDKSSISSSSDAEKERGAEKVEKYININNNEEQKVKKMVVAHKRPKKRFRKRVKKRQASAARESDGSSDEALPLSRMVDDAAPQGKDLKPKPMKKEPPKKAEANLPVNEVKQTDEPTYRQQGVTAESMKQPPPADTWEWRDCSLCGTAFRGERGLRRHMAMTHNVH